MESLAKVLVGAGLALAALGAVLWWLAGRGSALLPGDIVWQRGSVRVYFPVVTCLVISALLTLVFWWFRR